MLDKRSLYVGSMERSSWTQISLQNKSQTSEPGIQAQCIWLEQLFGLQLSCKYKTLHVCVGGYDCLFPFQVPLSHTHILVSLPRIDSRAGEQEAAQAAVGWYLAFNVCVTIWEGLNDLYKRLWEDASLIVDCALRGKKKSIEAEDCMETDSCLRRSNVIFYSRSEPELEHSYILVSNSPLPSCISDVKPLFFFFFF